MEFGVPVPMMMRMTSSTPMPQAPVKFVDYFGGGIVPVDEKVECSLLRHCLHAECGRLEAGWSRECCTAVVVCTKLATGRP